MGAAMEEAIRAGPYFFLPTTYSTIIYASIIIDELSPYLPLLDDAEWYVYKLRSSAVAPQLTQF